MVKMDSLRIDAPVGKEELEKLRLTKVGDKYMGSLMQGIDRCMEWTCVEAKENYWVFEATFCGISVIFVQISVVAHALIMNTMEDKVMKPVSEAVQ